LKTVKAAEHSRPAIASHASNLFSGIAFGLAHMMSLEAYGMSKRVILTGALMAAAIGLQGCVYASSSTQPNVASQPVQTVCDTNGNNCHPCDAGTPNCPVATTKKSWGFFF
jgi:hypothetical protein